MKLKENSHRSKNFLILSFLFLSIANREGIYAQKFQLELNVGASLSQISGDGTDGFRQLGANFGAYLFYDWKENWEISTGLLFHQKGARADITSQNISGYRLRTNYIDLPFHLNYHYKQFRFTGGPSINFLIGSSESTNFGPVAISRAFRPIEFSINGGVEYLINEDWRIGLHYQNSLFPVRDHAAGYNYTPPTNSYLIEVYYKLYNLGQYHSLFMLQLRYRLNKLSK